MCVFCHNKIKWKNILFIVESMLTVIIHSEIICQKRRNNLSSYVIHLLSRKKKSCFGKWGEKSECMSSKAWRFEIFKEHGRFISYQTRMVLPDTFGSHCKLWLHIHRRVGVLVPCCHIQSWDRQVCGVTCCWSLDQQP